MQMHHRNANNTLGTLAIQTGMSVRRPKIVWLFVTLIACLPVGTGRAVTPASGVGSARATAIPLRLTVGGVSVDLLDIGMSATIDPPRAGTGHRSASASITALKVTGPQPLSAGTVSTSAGEGESDSASTADVPLEAPGLAQATLQAAVVASSVDETGSHASVGAVLSDLEIGGGLIRAGAATASMSVDATTTGVTATKTLEIPTLSALRVGDLADAAGVALETLSVSALVDVANQLELAATGAFGTLLAQADDLQAQLDAALADLGVKNAELAAGRAALDAAEGDLAEAEAQLLSDLAAAALAQAAVDAAQAALDDAESDLALAVAALDAASDLGLIDLGPLQDAVDAAQQEVDSASAALVGAQATLSSRNATVAATQASIASLVEDVASLSSAVAATQASIDALQTTIASLSSALAATVASLDAFASDLRTLVEDASIVTFEGVHITLRATATSEGAVPTVEMSFDSLSLGNVEAAQDVSATEAATELLPKIVEAVNGVGAILGLPAATVGVLQPVATSGTDQAGYRYASASFTLLSLSVPTPDGHTLTMSLGDPEVFAEFAPAASGGPPPGDTTDGDTTSGDTVSGDTISGDTNSGSGSGGGGSGSTLPVTGVAHAVLPGLALTLMAAALGSRLVRRPRRR